MADDAGRSGPIVLNIDKLRRRLKSLEEDEDFSQLISSLRLIFISDSRPVPEQLQDIPVKAVTAALNNIDTIGKKECKLKDTHLKDIETYTDTSKYKLAAIFENQVTSAFYKLVQQMQEDHPRMMSFEEIKIYLARLSKIPEKHQRMEVLRECKVHYELPTPYSPPSP